MTALLKQPRSKAPVAKKAPVVTVTVTIVEVSKAGAWVGDIFVSDDERVLKRGPEVPRDVVLKVLVAMTRRDETAGAVRGRDGQSYAWQVVGEGD
jgi:hypothetical protein